MKHFLPPTGPLSLFILLLWFSLMSSRLSAQTSTTFCGSTVTATVIGSNSSSSNNSSSFPSSTWNSGATVVVNGLLTINQNISCNGVYFLMNPGSSISVSSSHKFTGYNGTKFSGCTTMWTGIIVQSGAALDFSQCIVEDAVIGVRFISGFDWANSQLLANYFMNDLTGMAAGNFPSSAPFRLKVFQGNHFTTDPLHALLKVPPLLPPYSQSSYPSIYPLRGIWITNGYADLSYGAGSPNYFNNLRYGIVNSAATVTITNCRFFDITDDTSTPDPSDGSAIYAQKSSLIIGGKNNGNCRFFNSGLADVYSSSTRALDAFNMTSSAPPRYGVKVTESSIVNATIRVTKNTYDIYSSDNFISAIYVERPPSNIPSGTTITTTEISDNKIDVHNLTYTSNPKVVIDVLSKYSNGKPDFAYIQRNKIHVTASTDKISGIRIAGLGRNFKVEYNTLIYNPSTTPSGTSLSYGIIAQDIIASGNTISFNNISSVLSGSGSSTHSYLQAGIHIENSSGVLEVCGDTLDNTFKGIECVGTLPFTRLKRNRFGSAAYGLYCSSTDKLVNQDHFENHWSGSYEILGAKYDVTVPSFKIYYDPSNTITDDAPPGGSWSPSLWFNGSLAGSNGVCNLPDLAITDKERDFITATTGIDTTAANWDTRRGLFYKLKNDPSIYASDAAAATYLSTERTTAAWQYAQAQQLFDTAFTVSSALNLKLQTLWGQYAVKKDSISLLDDLQASDTTSYDGTIAQNRAFTFQRLCVLMDSLQQNYALFDVTLQTRLQAAGTYVKNLPTTGKAYETNLQDLLTIMIHYAQGGDSLVVGDSTLLRSIAAQCQQYGGSSIRLAPLWLPHAEGLRYIGKEWETGCVAGVRNQVKALVPTAIIVPNPVTNVAQIIFSDASAGHWSISDMTGRVVQQGIWGTDNPQVHINTMDWKAGLYFMRYRPTGGLFSTTKFVVIH